MGKEEMERRIYLDHAATTPLDPEVLREMLPYFSDIFGNASSQHAFGQEAIAAVDRAREQVARAIGAQKNEIYFTSGGTESDNWAIRGIAEASAKKGKHIISSSIEHHAVLHALKDLENRGYEVTYLPVDGEGRVRVKDATDAMREDTILVTIMTANNEVGTIQPIREIAREAKKRGILVHTDAVQAVGAIPVDVKELGVDALSISGHKFYGPKGVGALYVRNGVRLTRLLYGGGQERTMRGGTYNTPAIVGMGAALEKAVREMDAVSKKVSALRDHFVKRVLSEIDHVTLNGATGADRLPSNANIGFRFVEGESILFTLDSFGIAVSSGSACSSGSLDPSHVLLAMGVPAERAHGTIRFSFGKANSEEDVDYTVDRLKETITKLRAFSPLYSAYKGEKNV